MVVTLLTGGVLGLVYLILSWRVVQVRQAAKVELGDGGDTLLLARIRTHANFAEYVPFCLVLLALVEMSYRSTPAGLWVAGGALVLVRVAHAIGMATRGANPARALGIAGTWGVILALSIWAIWLALT